MNLEEIRNPMCERCKLSEGCRHVCMMGIGNPDAALMIVAESASQAQDDAGNIGYEDIKYKLFWSVLERVVGYKKEDCYFTYMAKCRPHDGRPPTDQEAQRCLFYLKQELAAVKPKAVLTLGETVLNILLNEQKIGRCRGKVFELGDIKVVPTFAPFFVENAQSNLKNFATDIQKAALIAQGAVIRKSVTKIVICDTLEKVQQLIELVLEKKVCCFDFETNDVNGNVTWEQIYPTCLAISVQEDESFVIPLHHFETPFSDEEIHRIAQMLAEFIFENKDIKKIGQNIKFDMHVWWWWKQVMVMGTLEDTMLMHHILDNTQLHGLKVFGPEYFPEYRDYDSEVKQYAWEKVPLTILAAYSGEDTNLTLKCFYLFEKKLKEDEEQRQYILYRRLTMAALKPLWRAEANGMPLNREFLLNSIRETEGFMKRQEIKLLSYKQVKRYELYAQQHANDKYVELMMGKIKENEEKLEETGKKTYQTAINKLNAKIAEVKAGIVNVYEGLNMGSPKQLNGLLYNENGFHFKLPYVRKKRMEAESTEREVLLTLKDRSGFVDDLMVWRSMQKIRSTYLQGIYNRLDSKGYVHTSFLLHGTETGRLASKNPNLQNLPNISRLDNELAVKTVKMVKKAFIVPKGMTLVSIDYSQAELRLMAEYAEEPTMIKAYAENKDLHIVTAAHLLKMPEEEFMALPKDEFKKHRTRAKAGNFGLIYGIGSEGFIAYAKTNYNVVLTVAETDIIRREFFNLYSAIPEYHSVYIAKARKFGYVRTLFGRRRYLPDIYSEDSFKRGNAERAAINTPIQGTAGEFTIFALSLLHKKLHRKVKLVNTIHDSMLFFMPDEMVDDMVGVAVETCENLPIKEYFNRELKHVKMKVDVETSKETWLDLAPYN